MAVVKTPPKILLKSARTNTGLSAKEVGKVINKNYQTILKYEDDSTNIPISLLNALSSFYEYPKDYIFLGKNTEYKRYKKELKLNELIKITSNNNDEQLVSARDLHRGLELKTRFSLWWEQNSKFLIENEDFTSVVSTTVVNNGARRQLQDYALTIDTAKHIAMMAGTCKGYEFRAYFIQVEKAWNSPDMVMKRALQIADKRVLALEMQNAEMKPKALFADSVAASHTSILVGDLAKLIKQNGFDIGQNRLFVWLRDNGWLISRKGELYNSPTQKGMNKEFFEIKERVFNNPDGTVHIKKTTKVTGKGQIYFVNKFLQEIA